MKIDKFTKVVLLVIAVFLGIIALKMLVQVKTVHDEVLSPYMCKFRNLQWAYPPKSHFVT